MSKRSTKAMLNMVALSFSEIIAFVVSLVLPRVILAYYGSAYNGLVLSISQFLKYISFLTLGVAGPTRVALYSSLAKHDTEATSRVVKATEIFYRKVACAFIGYVIILTIILPYLKVSEFDKYEVIALVLIISIGTFFEYCFGLTYKTLLDADQRMYVYIWVQTIVKIINVSISVVLIISGFSIFVAQLYASICNATTPLILLIYVRKKYGLNRKALPDYSGLEQRKDAAASSIANIVHSNTDVFLLTVFSNSVCISVYSVYMLIMGGVQSIMRIFTTGLEAAFGNMWANNETASINRNLEKYEHIMYSFAVFAFSCTGLLIVPFVSLYTNVVDNSMYIRKDFAILLTITTALFCVRQPYLTMVQAAGKYKETRNGAILEAVLNFGISLVLVRKIGLLGVTIGTLVANTFRTMQYAYFMSKNLIFRPMSVVYKRMLWAAITSTLIVMTCYPIAHIIDIDSWKQWILLSFIVVGIAIIELGISSCIFYRNTTTEIVHMFTRMIKRKKVGAFNEKQLNTKN